MKTTTKNLIGLRTETEDGQFLGIIQNIVIDIDTQSILEYWVKPSSIIKKLVKEYLIVTRGQVVEIGADKMVVADINIQEKNINFIKNKKKTKKEVVGVVNKDN